MINIILAGARGRMGTAFSQRVKSTDHMQVVLGLDTVGDTTGDYPVVARLPENTEENVEENADLIVCFLPSTAMAEAKSLFSTSLPMVVCTTGLTPDVEEAMAAAAQKKPIFYAANMSVGVSVVANVLKKMAPFLYQNGFDIEIVESHHNQKVDAPSGTARLLEDTLRHSIAAPLTTVYDSTQTHARREKAHIGVHSIRGGTIVGEHQVLFAGPHESIKITHQAQSREVFVEGTIRAVDFIVNKPPGLYSMEDLIDTNLK